MILVNDDPQYFQRQRKYKKRINTARATLFVLAVLYVVRIISMEVALAAHTSHEGPNITTRLGPFVYLITAISCYRATLDAFKFAGRFMLLSLLVAVACISTSPDNHIRMIIYGTECVIMVATRLLINRGKDAARAIQKMETANPEEPHQ